MPVEKTFVTPVQAENAELMMNCLNSVLVQGIMAEEPTFFEKHSEAPYLPTVQFSIEVNHFFREEGSEEIKNEISIFEVEAYNDMAWQIKHYGHKGRRIRVVARMQQLKDRYGPVPAKMKLIANHVEFLPEAIE
jgi:single-stranded DNA-binding protein